jgi:predicted chitinase
MINKELFFEGYRKRFGALKQAKVDAINFLLDKLDDSKVFNLAYEYAYILATIFHETQFTMEPITERGTQAYLHGKKYYPYIGRGFVQLTWLFNYKKFGDILKINLVEEPELANDPETAWKILELGMSKGLYTGKKLGDYVNENGADYYNARRVINGVDCASAIKSYAEKFESCIEFREAA